MTKYRRDDGTEIEAEHVVEEYGDRGDGWNDPPTATIVSITECWDLAGNDVVLTDGERERIEREIGDQIDSEGPEDDYYPEPA